MKIFGYSVRGNKRAIIDVMKQVIMVMKLTGNPLILETSFGQTMVKDSG